MSWTNSPLYNVVVWTPVVLTIGVTLALVAKRSASAEFDAILPGGSQSLPVQGLVFKTSVRHSVSLVGSTPTGFRQNI
jgi:hypothetical protein